MHLKSSLQMWTKWGVVPPNKVWMNCITMTLLLLLASPSPPAMSGSITSEERPGWELVWREVPFHPQVKYYRDPAFWLRYVQGWNMSWPVDYHVVPVWWSVCRKSVKLELATRFYYFELFVVILNRLIMKDIEIMGYRFKNLMKKIIRLELSKMFALK